MRGIVASDLGLRVVGIIRRRFFVYDFRPTFTDHPSAYVFNRRDVMPKLQLRQTNDMATIRT